MNPPRSIFTGSASIDASPLRSQERRLSTPEYRETLTNFPGAPGSSLFSAPSPPHPRSPASSSSSAAASPLSQYPPATKVTLPDTQTDASPPQPWTRPFRPSLDPPKESPNRVSPANGTHPPRWRQRPSQATTATVKRSLSLGLPSPEFRFSREPPSKRRRLQDNGRLSVDNTAPPLVRHAREQPPSPLFFSNHPQSRPKLPPRFSSSEAAAKMLSMAKEEPTVKTVTLARGTPSDASPQGIYGRSVSSSASEMSGVAESSSPEGKERSEAFRILGSVGVVEVFEPDTRPTFIVDLVDAAKHSAAGTLKFVFANSSLRSKPDLLARVSGKRGPAATAEDATSSLFHPFKSWLLGNTANGGSPEQLPATVAYAGYAWSCTTLRRRLRIVSGCEGAPATPLKPLPQRDANPRVVMSPPAGRPVHSNRRTISESSLNNKVARHRSAWESQDYFNSLPPPPEEDEAPGLPEAIYTDREGGAPASAIKPLTPRPAIHSNGVAADRGFDLPLDESPSLANECVLRAAAAEEADWSNSASGSNGPFFDWTRLPLSPTLPRHIQFARGIDWASTALGPIENWSADLRQMSNLIMASPHPAAMYWGDELVAMYNEAYIMLAGQKHPTLMGQRYRDAWAEIWDEVKDVFAQARLTGQATMKDDDCLFLRRSNCLEETYFSWSIIPMIGGDGTVMGLYNPAFEKTRRKIAERRMLTLREVGERTATARDVKGFWAQVLAALSSNEYDFPFSLLYSVSDDNDSDSSSMHSSSMLGSKQCYLEGSLGVPRNHPCAPSQLELKTSPDGFAPVFREVVKTDKPCLLDIGTGELPAAMMDRLDWRGFGDPCKSVVVCPIHPTTGEAILGFLVMGVNPRRPYDDDYMLFIQLLSRQLATSLASVVLFEEEIRRGQRAAKLAALDRLELSEQLAARTQEAKESETRFTRMAEFSPAGLFIADSEGHITYCNDTWYEISRVPRDAPSTDRWIDAVKEEDQEMVKSLWTNLVEKTQAISAEMRFKAPWVDRSGKRADTWVLFSAYPEASATGQLKSVFGSITNISPQKWAEDFQKRKMEEAVELKRQQENFIDITSHEMRNPLSAILQCADEISTTLSEFRAGGSPQIEQDLVDNSIDAAQTIALCALHQKRIVDDVLTLSKIDSAMLRVTPVDAQPLQVVQRALKMFEGEVQTADIKMALVVDPSYRRLGVDWVKVDPSRVLQVLINLTTNAIKFTTTESKRTIKVSLTASLEKPSANGDAPVKYFPMRSQQLDQTLGPDWGDGEVVYLQFAVQDTGRGLSEDEKKLLFLRFSQASPRTHVQYGGSGLGLFISRQLTELQGGEIGVASEAGKGSTFAFYVRARRVPAPQNPTEQLPIYHGRGASGASAATAVDPGGKKEAAALSKNFAKKAAVMAAGSGAIVDDPEPDAATAAAATAAATAAAANPLSARDRGRIRVLIVEDNLVNQRVLQKQLKNKGFSVAVANHGGEALDLLRESQFWHANAPPSSTSSSPSAAAPSVVTALSVVLMDQEMPVMDGLACTRRIREWEDEGRLARHVPIIAVTANARNEQIRALVEAGMDDVVSKPFRIPELVPKIEELAVRYGTVGEEGGEEEEEEGDGEEGGKGGGAAGGGA